LFDKGKTKCAKKGTNLDAPGCQIMFYSYKSRHKKKRQKKEEMKKEKRKKHLDDREMISNKDALQEKIRTKMISGV
jgi:hypothetical protein